MTIAELKLKYSKEELSAQTGDKNMRREMFAPLFSNLFESKVLYAERIRGIVKLEDIIITPEGFSAKAIPYMLLETGGRFDEYFFVKESWEVGAIWPVLHLGKNNNLSPYSGWRMWVDPETVRKTEELILNKNFDEANEIVDAW